MLALAEAFIGRGHDVTWVAQPSVGGRARSAGCEFLPFEGIESYTVRESSSSSSSTSPDHCW